LRRDEVVIADASAILAVHGFWLDLGKDIPELWLREHQDS